MQGRIHAGICGSGVDPIRRRRRQRVVVEDHIASLLSNHVWWIFSTGQLVTCCCCPCVAGQSIGCWDDLGDASSFGQGDGRESDRHDTGVLGAWAGVSSESLAM